MRGLKILALVSAVVLSTMGSVYGEELLSDGEVSVVEDNALDNNSMSEDIFIDDGELPVYFKQ